jgi:DNA helicase-2/ATP-dependent DNA helicase PcrA
MANELREKLRSLGVLPKHNIFIGTLHSFCLLHIILPFAKLYQFPVPDPTRIMSERDQAVTYQALWENFEFKSELLGFAPEYRDGKLVEHLPMKFQKYRRTHLDGLSSDNANSHAEQLINQYESALLQQDAIDFDLKIKWSMQLVEQQEYVRGALEAKFPWLLVDEYQDVGLPLHRMVKALTQSTPMKLFAIGDLNQCIYGFTGANPDYLAELHKMRNLYGEPITITDNHRSRRKILRAASIIAPHPMQLDAKRTDSEGVVKPYNTKDSPEYLINILRTITQRAGIPPKEIMILSNRRAGCQHIAQQIQESNLGIPCYNSAQGEIDFRRPLLDWIRKLLSYSLNSTYDSSEKFRELCHFWQLILRTNGMSYVESSSLHQRMVLFNTLASAQNYRNDGYEWVQFLMNALDLPALLIAHGRKSPDDIDEFNKFSEALQPNGTLFGLSLAEIQDRIERKDRLYIGTLHSSKGQESTTVIITNAEALNTNDETQKDQNRRLFYVGITRAKDQLYILHNRTSHLVDELKQGLS